MFRMTSQFCVEVSPERAWNVMSDIRNIHEWVPAINTVDLESEQVLGAGTVRVCHLKSFSIREHFSDWEEGRSFKYRGTGAPMTKWASNQWTIEPIVGSPNQCIIISNAEVELKGGIFSRPLEPLMKLFFTLLLPNSAALLNYLMENGHAYKGDVRKLPPVTAFC